MSKAFTRKDFIKLSALASTGLVLASCGNTSDKDSKEQIADSPKESLRTNNQKSDEPAQKISVDLIHKGDARYEELRKGFNKRIEKFPAVIALCTSTKDISEAISYARKNKLPVAVRSGGHSMEGFSSNDGGMVINLKMMNKIELQSDNSVIAQPGCTLSHMYDTLLPKKRIIPAGSCGTVGLGGLTMGGGYGLFSRKHGLTCDNVIEATIVDGNGNIHNTKDDAELLWALRGGGAGNFGIVSELKYQSHPSPEFFQAHHFKAKKLDASRAKLILEKWFEFSVQLPETCFSAFVLNGETLNILVTNFEKDNQGILQHLMEELYNFTDEFRSSDPAELSKALKNYYGSLVPVYFKNSSAGLYKSFDDIKECIEEVFEKVIHNSGMIYQLNTMGGNIDNADFEKVSCYPHRSCHFVSELQAYWSNPSGEERLKRVSTEILKIIQDNGIKTQYINYCSLDFQEWESAYYGNNYSRLQAVKRKYDPDNIVSHPQSVKI